MPLVTRGSKGSPLTHDELDTNFTDLDEKTKSNQSEIKSNDVEIAENETSIQALQSTLDSLNSTLDKKIKKAFENLMPTILQQSLGMPSVIDSQIVSLIMKRDKQYYIDTFGVSSFKGSTFLNLDGSVSNFSVTFFEDFKCYYSESGMYIYLPFYYDTIIFPSGLYVLKKEGDDIFVYMNDTKKYKLVVPNQGE